jgi:formylmethanofuran dehydrogenase subunit E
VLTKDRVAELRRIDREICHVCGREEREPYTPKQFSMLTSCRRCGESTCSKCGDHDADLDGEDYHGTVVCLPCTNNKMLVSEPDAD